MITRTKFLEKLVSKISKKTKQLYYKSCVSSVAYCESVGRVTTQTRCQAFQTLCRACQTLDPDFSFLLNLQKLG